MRILHLLPAAKAGGAPVVLLHYLRASKGIEHYLVTRRFSSALFNALAIQCAEVHDSNISAMSFRAALRVLGFAIRLHPHIVHAHGKGGALYALVLTLLPARRFRIIYTLHGFHNRFGGIRGLIYERFEMFLSSHVDAYVAVSESEREAFVRSRIPGNLSKVHVIPNGVPEDRRGLPLVERTQLDRHKWNIVTLSRISNQKDLLTMMRAIFVARKVSALDIGLHVIGGYMEEDRTYYREVQQCVNDLNLDGHVNFWGELFSAGSYLHHFDVYLSTALWEGLPTGIIEAFLNRIAVVATDCMGNVDLVVHGETGYLAKMKQPEDIAEKLILCIHDTRRVDIVESAYSRARRRFSVQSHVTKLESLYCSVMK